MIEPSVGPGDRGETESNSWLTAKGKSVCFHWSNENQPSFPVFSFFLRAAVKLFNHLHIGNLK